LIVGEYFSLSRAQLDHMRELSRWHELQANPPKPPQRPTVPSDGPGQPQMAPNPGASHLPPPDRSPWPPVKPIEAANVSAGVEVGSSVFKAGSNWSKRGAAQGFLRWILANGEVKATEIFQRGQEAGISPKAIRKAQKVCGIRPIQRRRMWWWSMPPPRTGQVTGYKT
jgi:hypothetical protein